MKIRLAIRGFAGGVLQFEDRVEVESEEMDAVLPALAEKHAAALEEHSLHMIEIEFLDEPNPDDRFFRLGTDPSGMVAPIAIDLR
jgi:hypothetical protein